MERFQQIEEIFQEALQHDSAERDAYVRRACHGDTELQREVVSLLENHDRGATFEPWAAAAAAQLVERTSLKPGQCLGPYRIECFLAAGGMGEVYRATDTRLNRAVAIKISAARFSERFEREARVIASLNHPNICQLYDVGPNYLVMELVEGPTVADRIRQGVLPLDEALGIAHQIAEALEAAHEKGRVHRDLKPANVKVTPDGAVKLLDFGLAKATEGPITGGNPSDSPTQTISATRAGVILGTAAYMSPEQARGATVDRRADIWAFGCVLYEMLTGNQAFQGETTSDILAAVLRAEPDWDALPVKTPPGIRRLLRRCLERDRKQRLRDIGEARIAIETPEEEVTAQSVRQRPWPWALALAIALCLAAVGWWRGTVSVLPHSTVRLSAEVSPGTTIDRFRGSQLALSPDGTRIVVAESDADGRFRLVMRSLDQSQFVPLPGAELALRPFFSPDGQWIAFIAGGKLKKVPVQGGSPVTLCDAPFLPFGGSWGDDGNIVAAFNVEEAGLVQISSAGGASTTARELNREKGLRAYTWPQVLPGSQWVLVTGYSVGALRNRAYDNAEIDVISTRTGERKTVQRGGFFGRYLPGGYLAYMHENTLLAAPFDLRQLAVTGPPRPVVEEVNVNVSGGGDFDFSPKTGTFVYVSSKGQMPRSILWLDSAGRTQPLLGTPGLYENPRFSPDGKQLAFSMPSSPVRADIWIRDLESGITSRLTHLPGRNNNAIWTPDGKSIVFESAMHADGGIYWIRGDGVGEPLRLTDGKIRQAPQSISPDGKWLAWVQGIQGTTGPDTAIWTAPVEGDRNRVRLGRAEPFLHSRFIERQPRFSPDGRWLAYSTNKTGTYELYVRPFPGPGPEKQISTRGGGYPIWSRGVFGARHQLFFLTSDWHIMVADYTATPDSFAAGKPKVWSPTSLIFMGGNYPYDLAADGKRFAVNLYPGGTAEREQRSVDSITVVLNFFDELQRSVPAGGR